MTIQFPEALKARFQPERVLASGGFGTVFLATHVDLGRPAAIKVIHPEVLDLGPEQRVRFENEARLAASLSHPHIVIVLDHGEADGLPWIAYEYLPGKTLRHVIDQGPMDWRVAADVALQIARALEAAHSRGILHRDIKPENVMESEPGTFKVTDFGIAKQLQGNLLLTGQGLVLGTPTYVAPEMITGSPATAQTDIYSLGVVLFEMVAGRPPFDDPNPTRVLEMQVKAPVPELSDLVPGLPEELDSMVHRALAKKQSERYQTVAVVRSLLARLVENHPAIRSGRTEGPVQAPAPAPARAIGPEPPTSHTPAHPAIRASRRVQHLVTEAVRPPTSSLQTPVGQGSRLRPASPAMALVGGSCLILVCILAGWGVARFSGARPVTMSSRSGPITIDSSRAKLTPRARSLEIEVVTGAGPLGPFTGTVQPLPAAYPTTCTIPVRFATGADGEALMTLQAEDVAKVVLTRLKPLKGLVWRAADRSLLERLLAEKATATGDLTRSLRSRGIGDVVIKQRADAEMELVNERQVAKLRQDLPELFALRELAIRHSPALLESRLPWARKDELLGHLNMLDDLDSLLRAHLLKFELDDAPRPPPRWRSGWDSSAKSSSDECLLTVVPDLLNELSGDVTADLVPALGRFTRGSHFVGAERDFTGVEIPEVASLNKSQTQDRRRYMLPARVWTARFRPPASWRASGAIGWVGVRRWPGIQSVTLRVRINKLVTLRPGAPLPDHAGGLPEVIRSFHTFDPSVLGDDNTLEIFALGMRLKNQLPISGFAHPFLGVSRNPPTTPQKQ